MNTRFHDFLLELGFVEEEIRGKLKGNEFNHSVGNSSLSVKYIYASSESEIFESHQRLWNQNTEPVFIAVTDKKSHLINAKEKPDKGRPLKKSICIQSFEYGINTGGFENIESELISKSSVESAYFFDFVSKNSRKSNKTVDKDLLLNLLELKSDLIGNDQIIHLLILRCLFIKYLEDRGIFEPNYLLSILESGNPHELNEAFDRVARINGDIFKYDSQFNIVEIKIEYLHSLAIFFRYDYRSKQQLLFPYQFENIPIQLISHVYEAFLKSSIRKGDGIYYTPDFLVGFMLSQSFTEKLRQNPKATILDPAVGSGAFLVQAFQMILKTHSSNLNYEEKKEILKTQLFGIDIDRNALQIAAFSLYLALLEDESSDFIKEKIEQESPILPSLIGKTLISGNTILEDLFPESTFDCIVSNPPWGSVPTTSADSSTREVYAQERKAIDNKLGAYPEYEFVADYERSQAFIARVSKWGNDSTIYVMVVKNSIFLNDKTFNFRQDVLSNYEIKTFYELSHYNEILFKKTVIGEVHGEKVELGASEPCVVLVFQNSTGSENLIRYISPKLSEFAKCFEVIHYNSVDCFEQKQTAFINNDSLWKVLVNSDFEAHELIVSKLFRKRGLKVEARAGFQPKREMKSLGEPIWRELIVPGDFSQFIIHNSNLQKFNWNQELHRPRRDESIFIDNRIIIPVRPLKSDRFTFRGVLLNHDVVFKDDIISIRLKDGADYIENYLPYLGIINSALLGFLFFQLSTQWGKGAGKREKIRNVDLEKILPIRKIFDQTLANQMDQLVKTIINRKTQGLDYSTKIDLLNETVFDLYGLVEYEKEIIREFYDVRVKRAEKQESSVKANDIFEYFQAFKDSYSLMLANNKSLNGTYHISKNMGTVICISINKKSDVKPLERDTTLDILNLVKSKQLASSESLKVLFEEKVKVYDKEQGKFYIIKSNQFKDWTVRQALRDAKEEIDAFIKYLPSV